MIEKHPHAPALDRIGRAAVRSHFNISEPAFSNWKRRGVPRVLLNSMRTLAAVKGVQVPELYVEEKQP